MNLYVKIAKGYWRKHKAKLLVLCMIFLVGSAALVTAGLLIRSTKMEEIEYQLHQLGDYDFIAYDVLEETGRDICALKQVEAYGISYDMGTVTAENGAEARAAAFADAESERIYHLTPLRGKYPAKEGEVALDLTYAKACGVSPYPGEHVFLEVDGRQKEYTLSGIYEIVYDETYGGFIRYPDEADEGYVLPQVYLSSQEAKGIGSTRQTVYCQLQGKEEEEFWRFRDEAIKIGKQYHDGVYQDFKLKERIAVPNGRSAAYSYLFSFMGNSRKGSMEGIEEAIREGSIREDINSKYLIPVVAALVGLVIVVALYQIIENVLEDRMQNLGILRSIGMDRTQCFTMLSLEICAAACIMVPIGLAGGTALYQILRLITQQWGSGSSPDGVQADYYVRQVTANPWLLSLSVMGAAAVAVFVAFFFRICRMTILELLAGRKKTLFKKHGRERRYVTRSYLRILFDKVSFTAPSVFLLAAVGMAASFFGLLYAKEVGRMDSGTTAGVIEEHNMGIYDYVASKKAGNIYTALLENRHDYGIPATKAEEFLETDGIDRAEAAIVNNSGRLVWDQEAGNVPAILEKVLIAPKSYEAGGKKDTKGLSYDEAAAGASKAVFEATGYPEGTECYQTPFVGMRDTALEQMREYVYAGEIDISAIERGEEVILAVREGNVKTVGEALKAGDDLCLSDVVVLEDEMDTVEFYSEELGTYGELVYSETYIEDGVKVPMSGYCFGRRKDISVKVGAVVALPDNDFSRFYFQEESPVNIFISTRTYQAWSLPDVNYTNIAVSLTEDADVRLIDKGWYQMVAAGEHMESNSLGELLQQEAKEKGQMFSIFYQLDVMLVALTLFGISLCLYSRVRKQEKTIAVLRSLGMGRWKFARVMLCQNGGIVAMGAVLSFCPALLFQMAANQAKMVLDRQRSSGIMILDNVPRNMKERMAYYHIFSNGYFKEWLLVAALYLGIMILSMVPAYLYCQKKSIIETIEK